MDDLHVCHLLRRFTSEDWGGIETAVCETAKCQIKFGWKPSIYTTSMLSKPGPDELEGIPIERYPYQLPWFFLSKKEKEELIYKGGSPWSYPLLRALFYKKPLALIHTHVQHRIGGIARTIAKWRGIPYVVSIHGGFYTIPPTQAAQMERPFKKHLEWGKAFGWLLGARRTLQDADAIICIGEDEKKEILTHFPEKRVELIPHGVDPTPYTQADPILIRTHLNLSPKAPLILCVSRIDYQKNQLALVRAFPALLKKHPDAHLLLIGPVTVSDYHDQVLKEVEKLNITQAFTLLPGLPHRDPLLYSAFQAADLFVLPSHMEPFGIVILEAWAAGTPVITRAVGGISSFTTHNQNVIHLADDAKETLTHAMDEVLTRPELKNRLISSAFKEVKHFTWENVTQKLTTLYQELTK